MKIAILGGTGSLGAGLALRLCKKNEILIGSRSSQKAKSAAARLSHIGGTDISGGSSAEVALSCDAAVLATSYDPNADFLSTLADPLSGKLVVSAIVPLKVEKGLFSYARETGSAAEMVASILKGSEIAAAFHTVPAPKLLKTHVPLDMDILVATDSRETFESAAAMISSIDRMRPLYAGPLAQARTLEGLVPLLLNLAKLNRLRNPSVRFV
jgi:NADPH-dependent F420 reductase